MEKPRVVVADDHPLLRLGIEALLADNFDVVGAVSDGRALVEMTVQQKPEIVVLDIGMPVMNGLDAAQQIKCLLPQTKVVFLSIHSNPLYVQRAVQVGASAYVLKSEAASQLLVAIEHAMRGVLYLSPELDPAVLDQLRTVGRPSRAPVQLTSRQRQILQFIADGRQNKEIASELNIGTKTVEFHRARLMNKLGIHSVGQLTRFAIEEGLVGATGSNRAIGAANN